MKDTLALSHSWPLPLRRLVLEGFSAIRSGNEDLAQARFEQALAIEPNLPEAHLGLALTLRPGPAYQDWLARLHEILAPALYMEIGIEKGLSLRLARAPTKAIGIDPHPQVGGVDWVTETRIHAVTSALFFASPDRTVDISAPVELAFIDGDHRFEAVLHDLAELEPFMAPDGVIAIHDTWPLDELTSGRVHATGFYSGDGWKIVPCLKAVRPDLRIMTIPAAPTGLTLITGFSPKSSLLRERFSALVEAFVPLPYAVYAAAPAKVLNLGSNGEDALDQVLRWRASAKAKSS
ncbi:class I SAM-dependent methyltransferase [Lacibacterium aquatile]|uniref:Class I SAM-dependent methyltransferase n=1 Tax=Lacibacterium aquatile TaxID=1168082 RepID=A0ABW5DV84_9PROT